MSGRGGNFDPIGIVGRPKETGLNLVLRIELPNRLISEITNNRAGVVHVLHVNVGARSGVGKLLKDAAFPAEIRPLAIRVVALSENISLVVDPNRIHFFAQVYDGVTVGRDGSGARNRNRRRATIWRRKWRWRRRGRGESDDAAERD